MSQKIGYFIFVITHIVLVLMFGLNEESFLNRIIGIILSIVFILWSFYVGIKLYIFITDDFV